MHATTCLTFLITVEAVRQRIFVSEKRVVPNQMCFYKVYAFYRPITFFLFLFPFFFQTMDRKSTVLDRKIFLINYFLVIF